MSKPMAEETAAAKLRIGIFWQGLSVEALPNAFKAFVLKHRGAGQPIQILVDNQATLQALESAKFFNPASEGGLGLKQDQAQVAADVAARGKAAASFACTHFISDDSATFGADFPAAAQPLLIAEQTHDTYPTFTDWQDVDTFFDWSEGWSQVSDSRLKTIKVLKDHGENTVYKLTSVNNKAFLLKRYHGLDKRMENEFKNLRRLHDVGIDNVPTSLWQGNNCAFYSFIKGEEHEVNTAQDIQPIIDMLATLDNNREALRKKGLPMAPGARTTLRQYVTELNKQFSAVQTAAQRSPHGSDTMMFMFTDMEQMRQDNINHFYLWCKRQKWDLDAELQEEFYIASPGDFGIHNTLQSNDDVYFVDWERSGWDDPAKLLADFFHNDEQSLSIQDKLQVLNAFVAQRESWDANFLDRFYAVSDLVAVEWVLKRLMVVVPEEMARLKAKNPGLDEKSIIAEQLAEAQAAHKQFQPMEHVCKHDQLLEGSGEYEGDPTENSDKAE